MDDKMKGSLHQDKVKHGGFFYSLTPIALFIATLCLSGETWADTAHQAIGEIAKNVEFDPSFLNVNSHNTVDLSRFANGSAVLPGAYRVEMYVNNQLVGNENIEFKARADKTVFPCITSALVKHINFDYSKLPANVLAPLAKGEAFIDLQKQFPEAQINFDSSEQRLEISIPQIYMTQVAQGTVNPALWDSGVPAALLGYSVNGYTSRSQGQEFNSVFAGINTGINVGAWYLRHNGSYNWQQNGIKKYSTINTYLQRDIPIIKGRVLLGQSNTSGQVFDSLPFMGAALASDERMLPGSLRGYAPDIRGNARSNARVTVSQGGVLIYQKTVTPGEFLINDLYPTGYGGDLAVTVREADGTESLFTVPYAAVPQLLRPGSDRYEVTLGELRSDTIRNKPGLYQATYRRGLTNRITGYGGLQASQDYYALQIGAAVGTPIGALAFDITQARTHLGEATDPVNGRHSSDNSMSGQSYQLSYSKTISETNTNLSLAAYRFSTDGYMDFITAVQTRDAVARGRDPNSVWRAKNRFTTTVGQGLPGNWGQLYISSSVQNYWNKEGTDQQFQMGYNNHYGVLSYGLNVSRTYSGTGKSQNFYALNFSFPLGRRDQPNVPQMRVNLNHDTNGNTGEQVGISGSAGAEHQYTYGVTAMHANNGIGSSGSLNGQYRSSIASLSGAAGAGQGYENASAGATGSIIAHPGGVTFSPYNSETLAVVQAKGAEGASVSSYPGVKIDRWGYAIVPYLDPYRMNEISIDPKNSASDVELDNTMQKVAPYSGAVVMLKYNTKRGMPLLIMATLEGKPVPFGADVLDDQGNNVGSVGQGGQIYARVVQERGTLRVTWGEDARLQCRVSYVLMPQQNSRKRNDIQRFDSVCNSGESATSSETPKSVALSMVR